jgi:hypothetical protein
LKLELKCWSWNSTWIEGQQHKKCWKLSVAVTCQMHSLLLLVLAAAVQASSWCGVLGLGIPASVQCESAYNVTENVAGRGIQIANVKNCSTVEACCAQCAGAAEPPCAGWSFTQKLTRCISFSAWHTEVITDGVTSGRAAESPTPSPPTPPTPPIPPPAPPAAGKKPHILLLVMDDWGWANVGFHNNASDIVTPNFDSLVKRGIELDRNYVFKFCSPTRSSIQSGRLPVHVNTQNDDPGISNPNDLVSGWAGIPREMTGMATVLKRGGYRYAVVIHP